MSEAAWACYGHTHPAPVATPCTAHGTGTPDAVQAAAEAHCAPGHPTAAGTVGGVAWAVRA